MEKTLKLGLKAVVIVMGVSLFMMGLVALFGLNIDLQDRLLNLALVWTFGFWPMVLHYRLRLGGRMTSKRIKYLAIAWPISLPILTLNGKLKRRW